MTIFLILTILNRELRSLYKSQNTATATTHTIIGTIITNTIITHQYSQMRMGKQGLKLMRVI